jgi:hypothetical protein
MVKQATIVLRSYRSIFPAAKFHDLFARIDKQTRLTSY